MLPFSKVKVKENVNESLGRYWGKNPTQWLHQLCVKQHAGHWALHLAGQKLAVMLCSSGCFYTLKPQLPSSQLGLWLFCCCQMPLGEREVAGASCLVCVAVVAGNPGRSSLTRLVQGQLLQVCTGCHIDRWIDDRWRCLICTVPAGTAAPECWLLFQFHKIAALSLFFIQNLSEMFLSFTALLNLFFWMQANLLAWRTLENLEF